MIDISSPSDKNIRSSSASSNLKVWFREDIEIEINLTFKKIKINFFE